MSRLPSMRCSGVPPSPRNDEPGRHALAVVLGVEDDHAALLHVGVDLGERRLGQRPRIGQHRPVEDREEGDLVGEDVDGERLTGLHGRALDQETGRARSGPAGSPRRWRVAGQHVAEGDLGGGLDGARVVAARPRGRCGGLAVLWAPAGTGGTSSAAVAMNATSAAAPARRDAAAEERCSPACSSSTATMSANSSASAIVSSCGLIGWAVSPS